MLLVISDESVVDFACDVSFEAPDDVFFGESFGCPTGDVFERWLVPSHANYHCPINRCVGLAVTTSVEPVTVRHARRSRYWAYTDKFRERCFRTDPVRVVAGNDHHFRRAVRSDSVTVTKCWHSYRGDLVKDLFVVNDFYFELLESACQSTD